jgi:hypothetical protein
MKIKEKVEVNGKWIDHEFDVVERKDFTNI